MASKVDLLMKKLVEYLSSLFKTGFFHIFGAGSINKIIQTLMSVLLVRVLSKDAYGVYAYAYNIVSFYLIFNGFGATSALIQIGSELYDDESRAYAVLRYGRIYGFLVDVTLCTSILLVALFVPLAIDGGSVILALYAPFPLMQFLCDTKTTQLRVRLQNRQYASMTNLQTAVYATSSVIGAYVGGAEGLAIGQSLGLLVSYTIACRLYPLPNSDGMSKLTVLERKDFRGIAIISAFNGGISQALTLVGTFLVGHLLANSELVATYKAATTIPFGLMFIPNMLMIYSIPRFARNRWDKAWTLREYARVIIMLSALMGSAALLLFLFGKPLVLLLFGEAYLDSVSVLRVLLLGMLVSSVLRTPAGNLLVTQRKLRFNAVVGIASILANVFLSFAFIPTYGVMGAALAWDLTMVVGAALSVPYYIKTILMLDKHGHSDA